MSVVETTIGVCQNDYCVCRQMLYNDRVGSDDPAFGDNRSTSNLLVRACSHRLVIARCWLRQAQVLTRRFFFGRSDCAKRQRIQAGGDGAEAVE